MSRIRTGQERDKKELEIKELKENISTLSKRLGDLDSVMVDKSNTLIKTASYYML